jgi:hypothetical protein
MLKNLDLRNFINSCYEHSKIKKENVFHHRLFRYLFQAKDKMTENELKQELKEIGKESKGSNFGPFLH